MVLEWSVEIVNRWKKNLKKVEVKNMQREAKNFLVYFLSTADSIVFTTTVSLPLIQSNPINYYNEELHFYNNRIYSIDIDFLISRRETYEKRK